MFIKAIDNSNSILEQYFLEELPDADYTVHECLSMPEPFFAIQFNNVNEDDADKVKKIVENAFADYVKYGLDENALNDILDYFEISKEYEKDTHGYAENMTTFYEKVFSSNGEDLLGLFRTLKGIEDIEIAYKNGKVQELLERYISSDDNASLTITTPKNGLLEANENSKKQKLRQYKESLSDEKIKEIIKNTDEYDKWIYEQSNVSLIDKIRVASLSNVFINQEDTYAYEENVEGIRFIRSIIDDTKKNGFSYLFDISDAKYEDTLKLRLLADLLFQLSTKNYEDKSIREEFDRVTASYGANIYVNHYYNGGYKCYFEFNIEALDKNIDKIFELLKEVMFNTNFDDVEFVRNYISSSYNSYRQGILSSPEGIGFDYAHVMNNSEYLYDLHMDGIDYMNFMAEIIDMSDEEIEKLLKECETLLKEEVYNRDGLVCQIVGNFDTVKNIKEHLLAMSYNLNERKIVQADYSKDLTPLKNKIAIVAGGTMQYNIMSTAMKNNDIKYTGKYEVLRSILDDKILYNEFRAKRSVYGAYSAFDRENATIYTYKDPNLKESIDVMRTIPDLFKNLELTQEELVDYKLNALSTYSYPFTRYNSAWNAITELFAKYPENRTKRFRRYLDEISSTTLDDVKELSNILDKIVEDNKYVSAGSKDQIEENSDMFDEIIYYNKREGN